MGQLKRRLLYFCVLAALCFMVNAKIQKIVRGPSNTSARLNETVVLKCQIENQVRISGGKFCESPLEIVSFRRGSHDMREWIKTKPVESREQDSRKN